MHTWLSILSIALLAGAATDAAAAEPGRYARIAVLRPHDGDTVDFEAGYIRHLDWHKQAGDTWTWYGWTVTYGDRQRWFLYATFGHAATDFDNPVSPAEDERDNVLNVTPHAQFVGNALYERMVYDDNAQPVSTNFGEYLLPLATDVPHVDLVHLETPSPLNPLGMKGAGEGGTIPAIAAIVGAVENALAPFGVIIAEAPITPQRIVELLGAHALGRTR